MPKNTKLKSLKQTHAKVPTNELTCLDQVWGFNENSRYGTTDENEYRNTLGNMTRVDLENHARSVGTMVLESSDRMRDALMNQFRSFVLALRKPSAPNPSKFKVSAAVLKTLNEGR